MADCTTCEHRATLHNPDGTCSVAGCACDQLALPEFPPNVQPPTPGACLHTMHGAVWVVEDIPDVHERLTGVEEFASFTACDFEEGVYCTYPFATRPQAVLSYHAMIEERWERILREVR